MLQNCFEKVLKFWRMYYYYELGYYYFYYTIVCPAINNYSKYISPKKSASNIGHQLFWFLNIIIGQRKNLVGRPLLQTLKLIVFPRLLLLLMYFECKGALYIFFQLVFICYACYVGYCMFIYIYLFSRRFYPKRLTIEEYNKRYIYKEVNSHRKCFSYNISGIVQSKTS